MGMQDANDFYPLPCQSIGNQVRPAGMNSDRGRELTAYPGHPGEFSKKIEDREQTVSITLCLVDAPRGGPMEPDSRKVGFCGGPNDPTAISRHAVRASGP